MMIGDALTNLQLSSRASPLARPGTQAVCQKSGSRLYVALRASPAGMTAFETQKLIGISLEGSVG